MNRILKTGMSVITCALALAGNGQTMGPYPINTDLTWYNSMSASLTPGGYIAGLNTATIDVPHYGPNGQTTTLIVSDYYGNGTPGGIVFTDELSGNQVQITYNNAISSPGTAGFYIVGSPDVTIANSYASPTNTFIVAMAYICWNPPGPLVFNPQIDYWQVTYTGPGTFIVKYLSSAVITGCGEPSTIHIDVAAEFGNTGATGLPWCDQFVVTWDDIANGNVYANSGSINAMPGFAEPSSELVGPGQAPDVAAIQRYWSSCSSCPPALEYFGLIAYTTNFGQGLDYNEWDASLGTYPLGLSTLLDFGYTPYFGISFPRIDAIDDYTINTPTSTRAYYKVVSQNLYGGVYYSYSYDNITAAVAVGPPLFNGWDNAPFSSPANDFAPTVAFGAGGETQYDIAHSTDFAPPGYPTWNTFMEPIDWTNSYSLAAPNFYYLVNNTPFPIGNMTNGNYLTAISTPCNNPSDQTLVAWTNYNNATGFSTVYYKITQYPYAFRQAAPASATVQDWKIYPNPAAALLNIANPLAGGERYEVTDMLGSITLNGMLTAGTQVISLNMLVPGTYVIRAYNGEKAVYTAPFVKQ